MERALETLELYAHFCRATGSSEVRPVATSAIREASNRDEFLQAALDRTGLEVRVLSREEEARYGYLAAVNSTTLADGVALDLGGGSMQLTRVEGRLPVDFALWALGAVRMTERFLPGEEAKGKQLRALRDHVAAELEEADWLPRGGHLVGVGGTVRNLAAAAEIAASLPSYGVQGFALTRAALDSLVDALADLPASERSSVPGIKANRSDLILAGAVVVQSVMEIGGFDAMEVTEAGLREGVFYETLLDGADPPLFEDVRRASVRNMACAYGADFAHTDHVARLALELWDALGPPACTVAIRWSATCCGRGDAPRHRHGRRLRRPPQALALPDPQRLAAGVLPARDGPDRPDGPLPPEGLARPRRVLRAGVRRRRGDARPVLGGAEAGRAARAPTRSIRERRLRRGRRRARRARLTHSEDVTVARWAAERKRDLFERAWGATRHHRLSVAARRAMVLTLA